MSHRGKWYITRLHKIPGSSTNGRRFSLFQGRKWTNGSYTPAKLRRMADAMQDAVDGNYGQTHEWDVSPCDETTRIIDNGRLNIAVSVAEFERLVELIDNLLEEY